MKAFAEVMRGGAGNTLVTGSSQKNDKPDARHFNAIGCWGSEHCHF